RHVPAQSGNPPITGTSPCPRRLFGEGFAVSFSNPNVFIFMAAVLPQVLAEGADFTSQLLTLLGTMIVTVGLLHLSYALLAAAFGAWLEAESRQRAVQRIAGALFILLGLKATLLS
ncbi:LysE family transporter, partial [Corallococcus exiguus]|uniref:LysE family translocator n=1 Tax=Corallococcus exiguus TaxID=83462 RepID=UPI001473FC83